MSYEQLYEKQLVIGLSIECVSNELYEFILSRSMNIV